jgi:hypothetical protein
VICKIDLQNSDGAKPLIRKSANAQESQPVPFRMAVCRATNSPKSFTHYISLFLSYSPRLCFTILTITSHQWPRGLRRRFAVARLLRSWVRIPPGAWLFVCCKCCVLSGRGLCDELITRPKESYRMWCVVVSDLEIS